MKKTVAALIAVFFVILLNLASAAYVAEIELHDTGDSNSGRMTFAADGKNLSILFKQDGGQLSGLYKINGVTYAARKNRGEWLVINADEMLERMALFNFGQQSSADVKKNQELELVDLKKNVEHAGYQGKLYKVIVSQDGRVVSKSTIAMSEHKDIVLLRNDFLSLSASLARHAGQTLGALSGVKELILARDALDKINGGILQMASNQGRITLMSLKPEGGPIKLPAPPQDPVAGLFGGG